MAGGGKGRYEIGQNADINVTPFVDVMLVLLIIFMVAAPMAVTSIKIDLPPAQAPKTQDQKKPHLHLDPPWRRNLCDRPGFHPEGPGARPAGQHPGPEARRRGGSHRPDRAAPRRPRRALQGIHGGGESAVPGRVLQGRAHLRGAELRPSFSASGAFKRCLRILMMEGAP
ncbi:MAG: biopolymer transporter ExbD [Caulobacteraceae bacterium]